MKNIQIKVSDSFHQRIKLKSIKDRKNISRIGRNLFTMYLKGEIDNGIQTVRHENKHG
jgi:hypothetical protein